MSGRIKPRLVTPSRGYRTFGPDVGRWWKAAGADELMAWQRFALGGMLQVDDAGRWAHRHALVTVARQNGKTTMLEALIGWWLTGYARHAGRQQVTLTSHDLRLTAIVFERLAFTFARLGVLEANNELGRRAVRLSHGRQDLRLADGSELIVQSAAASAGHGFSPDLVVVDEVWRVSDDAVDNGLLPAQRARPNPLTVFTSTAGDDQSKLLQRWREHGLRTIDAGGSSDLWFAEWSPPSSADPMRETSWPWANPALGRTITLETLRTEARGPNRAAFLRASLNLWVAAVDGWLGPGRWEALARPGEQVPAGGCVACDTAIDGSRWVAVYAGRDDAGVGVRVGFVADDEASFWSRLDELVAADPRVVVALTPTLESHAPASYRKRVVSVGTAEIRKWTALVRSAILAGDVWHSGEIVLAEQVTRAVAANMDGGMILSSARSAGPIELARCLVWAVALVTRPISRARPSIGVASTRS